MSALHILILTPSLGKVSLGYRDTYAQVVLECHRRGIKVSVADAVDPGQLVHARNALLGACLESDATHAFWWDADVYFAPRGLFELLGRTEPMICRPYPMRSVDWTRVRDHLTDGGSHQPQVLRRAAQHWTVALHYDESGRPVWSDDRQLVRVNHCGFGWVLFRMDRLAAFARNVLGPLADFDVPPGVLETDWASRRIVRGFDLLPTDKGRVTRGEDVSFCARWTLDGHPLWAAPYLSVRNGEHEGRFASYLESHDLLPRPELPPVAVVSFECVSGKDFRTCERADCPLHAPLAEGDPRP
ncbi:MAG TPA: hypothetical protein VGY54_21090 [Polyangiaceae bacterium]|jgi:hypothetical protein|nr:hypothetical protein [Polyangiaceae bacterium]